MKVQLNTDNHIEGKDRMENYFATAIGEKLKRFEDHVTSLQVYLGDENADKIGDNDKRCTIEARLIGKPPVAVVCHSESIEKSIHGAIEKMKRALDHAFDKIKTH